MERKLKDLPREISRLLKEAETNQKDTEKHQKIVEKLVKRNAEIAPSIREKRDELSNLLIEKYRSFIGKYFRSTIGYNYIKINHIIYGWNESGIHFRDMLQMDVSSIFLLEGETTCNRRTDNTFIVENLMEITEEQFMEEYKKATKFIGEDIYGNFIEKPSTNNSEAS